MMLTSLDVSRETGISRATLNNYIALGLLPRPQVKPPEKNAETSARQIGYFPSEVIDRIKDIQSLKKSGYSISEITQHFTADMENTAVQSDAQTVTHDTNNSEAASTNPVYPEITNENNVLRVTIENIPYPAYMVNYNFEVTWFNDSARNELLGGFERLPADIKERNALVYLLKGKYGAIASNREAIVQFHLAMGKGRITRNDLMGILTQQMQNSAGTIDNRFNAESMPSGSLMQFSISLQEPSGEIIEYCIHASYYREGILFVYAPKTNTETLLGLLERRDEVIRTLLKKRLPVLTDVTVLVADLQNSVKICTELPPDEYFELINQIWATMEPIFRKYYGTHGKHVGDGMVYYFLPQPDCNYILNALLCAQEIKTTMRKISKEWQLRKNWFNELYLNIGLNEGQEWLGVFHVDTKVEFTVLGDTINHTSRLSDFSRCGAIWATKNLLGKLSTEIRKCVKFGIRRNNENGYEVMVESSYSRMVDLINLDTSANEKLRDIAVLPVTEIFDVIPPVTRKT